MNDNGYLLLLFDDGAPVIMMPNIIDVDRKWLLLLLRCHLCLRCVCCFPLHFIIVPSYAHYRNW